VVKSSIFLGVMTHYFLEQADGKELEVIRPSEVGTIIPNETPVKLQVDAPKINVFTEDGAASLIQEGA
jgi:iron(III) transport system ATP-binding protein